MMSLFGCCPSSRPYRNSTTEMLGDQKENAMADLIHKDNQAARLTKANVIGTSLAECFGIALIITSIVLCILVSKSSFPTVNNISFYAGLAVVGFVGCVITLIATNRLYFIYKKYLLDIEVKRLIDSRSSFSY